MTQSYQRSILVIDSGVGGLSVSQAILAAEPSLQIIYFADDAFFPYGLMQEDQLMSRLKTVVGVMIERHQPELVVLACNTVSTLVLPELRALYHVPFVGVVPAIKPAAQQSQTKRIGLLATPATVRRSYTDDLIKSFADDCDVVRVGSNDLVVQAERLLAGEPVCKDTLLSVLQPFLVTHGKAGVDTIVLGCTHFPLLREQLTEIMPSIKLIDSGEAIARRVVSLLDKKETVPDDACHLIYFSRQVPEQKQFAEALTYLGFDKVKLLRLEV